MNTQSEEMLSSAINKISDTLKQQKGAFLTTVTFTLIYLNIQLILFYWQPVVGDNCWTEGTIDRYRGNHFCLHLQRDCGGERLNEFLNSGGVVKSTNM